MAIKLELEIAEVEAILKSLSAPLKDCPAARHPSTFAATVHVSGTTWRTAVQEL